MNQTFKKSPLILLVLVAAAIAFAGCGSESKSDTTSQIDDIRAVLDKTSTIKSGNASIDGTLSAPGVPGTITLAGGGPFDTEAKGGPAYKLELQVQAAGSEQNIGIQAADGKNYLIVKGKAIEQEKSAGSLEPKQVSEFIKGLGEYMSSVEKTSDSTYTAKVDMPKLLSSAPGKEANEASKLALPGLGSAGEFAKQLGVADVTVNVDPQGYADKIELNVPITQGGSEGVLRVTISMDEINQPQTIKKPTDVVAAPSGG